MPTLARRRMPEPVVLPTLGLFAPVPIMVECRHFQGSLAALFDVVKARKIDLRDIPLAPICEAYFQYVSRSPKHSVDESAAALVALAYLIERKAWLLLPVYEPEPEFEEAMALPEGIGEDLRAAIEVLDGYRQERQSLFFRTLDERPEVFVPVDVSDVSVNDLALALEAILRKALPDPVEPKLSRRSLADQMGIVAAALSQNYRDLGSLLGDQYTRSEVVWWFLALLELIRLGQARYRVDEDTVRFAK